MRPTIGRCFGGVLTLAISLVLGCSDESVSPEKTSPQAAVADDAGRRGPEVPFDDLRLILEFNSTDNDLGVQLFLDAEDWKRVTGFDPGNRQIVEVETAGRLAELGLTELFF